MNIVTFEKDRIILRNEPKAENSQENQRLRFQSQIMERMVALRESELSITEIKKYYMMKSEIARL